MKDIHNCSLGGRRTALLMMFIAFGFSMRSGCAESWVEMISTGHKYMLSSTREKFSTAEIECSSRSSTVVMIKSEEENIFIQQFVIPSNLNDNIWIGINDAYPVWKFVDGTDYDVGKFDGSPWVPGDPDHSSSQQCAAINRYTYEWYDSSCSNRNYYMCQRTTLTEETTVLAETSTLTTHVNDITTGMTYTQMETTALPTSQESTSREDTTLSSAPTTKSTSLARQTTEIAKQPEDSTLMTTIGSNTAKCLCSCEVNNMTAEEYIQHFYNHISKQLVLDKSVVSKNVRKLNSATDERKSSQQIGFVGCALIIVPVVLFIILDLVPRA